MDLNSAADQGKLDDMMLEFPKFELTGQAPAWLPGPGSAQNSLHINSKYTRARRLRVFTISGVNFISKRSDAGHVGRW
jgi:hypothetical protein